MRPRFVDSFAPPGAAALSRAVRRRDWAGVVAWFDAVPAEVDPTAAAEYAAAVPGCEDFFAAALDRTEGGALAGTLYGHRLLKIGWRVRHGRWVALEFDGNEANLQDRLNGHRDPASDRAKCCPGRR